MIKTFEAFNRNGDEEYPYPLYTNALKKYLPSVKLFKEEVGFKMDNEFDRFVCDIKDFIPLNEDEILANDKNVYCVGFANNNFNGEGIEYLKKVEPKLKKISDEVLIGGINNPFMGGRDVNHIDLHGDTIYVFCEYTEKNVNLIKDIVGTSYDEFSYLKGNKCFRIWWD